MTWGDGLKLRPMALEAMLQFSTLVELQPENVSLSGVRHFSKITAPRILTKLGQKLEGDE